MINKKSKIFVAGHKGMVGSAIIRKLKKKGFWVNILIIPLFVLKTAYLLKMSAYTIGSIGKYAIIG